MLNEVHRVLSPNGVYICITYGVPENRLGYFNKKEFDWTVFTQKAAKPTISTSSVITAGEKIDKDDGRNFHYIYIMRKSPPKDHWYTSIVLRIRQIKIFIFLNSKFFLYLTYLIIYNIILDE